MLLPMNMCHCVYFPPDFHRSIVLHHIEERGLGAKEWNGGRQKEGKQSPKRGTSVDAAYTVSIY